MADAETNATRPPGRVASFFRSLSAAGHLREWLFVVTCLGILAAVAIYTLVMPWYQHMQLTAKFAEVVKITERYKLAIEICAKFDTCAASGTLSGLEEGRRGIPDTTSSAIVARVSVAENGTITAIATKSEGLAGETYVLTPTYVKGVPITWAVSGTCRSHPNGAIC